MPQIGVRKVKKGRVMLLKDKSGKELFSLTNFLEQTEENINSFEFSHQVMN